MATSFRPRAATVAQRLFRLLPAALLGIAGPAALGEPPTGTTRVVPSAAARDVPAAQRGGAAVAVDGWIEAHLDEVVALYTDLHRAPELSLAEERTAARMADELRALGAEVTIGVGGHGVVGVLRSVDGRGPVLMLRADMDALPIVEQTGLPYASAVRVEDDRGTTVGVMHACGHDVHMAALVGALRWPCMAPRTGPPAASPVSPVLPMPTSTASISPSAAAAGTAPTRTPRSTRSSWPHGSWSTCSRWSAGRSIPSSRRS